MAGKMMAGGGARHTGRRPAVVAGMLPAVLLESLVLVAAGTPAGHAAAADPGPPWEMHTIASGPRGADGVDLADVDGDGDGDVTSAWEQAGIVTVSLRPDGDPAQPWPTVPIADRLHGVEDAIFADVDADGHVDVVSACECRKLVVHFAPSDPALILEPAAWTAVTIDASVDLHRWIKVAVADVDGDGRLDIVGGGKVSPANVGWFRAPADPRDGAGWSHTPISPVSWTMSLFARDVDGDGDADVVLSDRLPIHNPDGTRTYELRGTRWSENLGAGAAWVSHPIGFARGEHKFLHIVDFDGDGVEDVLDGASGPAYNLTFIRRNLGQWAAWEVTPVAQPDLVGWYQDVKTGDVDLDGDLDLVFSYSHADGDRSGVVWLAAVDGGWQRGEISGPAGTKFDNVELTDVDGDGDLDAVTSEQIEQLGLVWYENPTQ